MNNFAITEKDQVSTGQRIRVGIPKVNFKGVSYDPLTEGKPPVMKLHFEDERGATHEEVVWEPNPEKIKELAVQYPKTHRRDDKVNGYTKGEQITPDEAVEIAYADFRRNMKHVATKFVSEQELTEATKGAASYEEFVKAFQGLFTDEVLAEGNPVWVSLPPNNAGYPTLSKYPPFIENVVEGQATTLQFSDYEKQMVAQMNEKNASDPEEFGASDSEDPTDFNPATFGADEATF